MVSAAPHHAETTFLACRDLPFLGVHIPRYIPTKISRDSDSSSAIILKKEGSITLTWYTTPDSNLLRMKWIFMNKSEIVRTPISTILFVSIFCDVKMRLVGHNQPRNEIITCELYRNSRAKSNRFMMRGNDQVESPNCAERILIDVCGFY